MNPRYVKSTERNDVKEKGHQIVTDDVRGPVQMRDPEIMMIDTISVTEATNVIDDDTKPFLVTNFSFFLFKNILNYHNKINMQTFKTGTFDF
jgi:hypothetical protein